MPIGEKVDFDQGDDEIKMEEWAERDGTIPYEIAVSISKRVPRVYREGVKDGYSVQPFDKKTFFLAEFVERFLLCLLIAVIRMVIKTWRCTRNGFVGGAEGACK